MKQVPIFLLQRQHSAGSGIWARNQKEKRRVIEWQIEKGYRQDTRERVKRWTLCLLQRRLVLNVHEMIIQKKAAVIRLYSHFTILIAYSVWQSITWVHVLYSILEWQCQFLFLFPFYEDCLTNSNHCLSESATTLGSVWMSFSNT